MARIRSIKPETPDARWSVHEFSDLLDPIRGAGLIYRLVADDSTLLYVGVTTNPRERLRNHAQRKPWWPTVARILLIGPISGNHLLKVERSIIKDAQPVHNVRSAV